jgi:hypothetical protein
MKIISIVLILIFKSKFILNQKPTITRTSIQNDGNITIEWNPNRVTTNKTRYKIEVTESTQIVYEWPGFIKNFDFISYLNLVVFNI